MLSKLISGRWFIRMADQDPIRPRKKRIGKYRIRSLIDISDSFMSIIVNGHRQFISFGGMT